jgi:hypothetical protein
MVSKVRERIYAESAAKLLGVDWIFGEIAEPLDFEVRSGHDVFGLEVRQIFVGGEADFGSPSRRAENENQSYVRDIASRYYSQGGRPVSVKFLGPISDHQLEALVERMVREAPASPFEYHTISVGAIKIFITAQPKELGNCQHWVCIDDHVGWVREATNDDLQYAVDCKRDKLPLYLAKYSTIDLLLVADRTVNSGRMRSAVSFSVQNPGFRAIYFLSYPETITRVG